MNKKQVKDPVCNMNVDPSAAPAKTDYDDRKYYFCSSGCKRKFDHAPEQYLGVRRAGATRGASDGA